MTKYLAIGMVVLVALLGVSGWLLKRSYAANGALETKLAGAQAVIDQREADAKANAIAVAQLADKLSKTETKVVTVTERIYSAPVTRDCIKSGAMRAAVDGVQQLYAAPVVQAPSGREPTPAVPGPNAPAK
jgi:predicted transcriptional regulator